MKKNLFNCVLIGGLLLCFVQLRAQDEKYDAIYLSLVREYTLNPDGSMDYHFAKQQKLLSYRAFHNLYGETFIVYDPLSQKLKINEAFTLMADGKKVITPENAFNEVLPASAANAPAYNNLREMVITHTGLERNAIINLDYQLHTQQGNFPALMGNEILAEPEPVKSLVLKIRIPAGQSLHFKMLNGDYQPEKTSEGDYQVYTWNLSNIPAISSEEAQPGVNEKYPRLIFSTSDKREEVYSFLTNQTAFRAAPVERMKNTVNEWLTGIKEKFDKALKLQEKIVNDMRLYPIALRTTLYQCRTPEQIWNENGGTPIEKAVLLATLLKSAGIDAQVAAVVRTALADEKIATLADIEDFAVKAEFRDRGTWYFSVSGINSVNLKLSLPGRSFIALKPGEKVSVTTTGNPKQMIKTIGTFIVSSDPRLTGEVSMYFEGGVYPLAGLQRDKNRMRNSLSGNLIGNDTANLKVSTLNSENGFQTYIVQSVKPFRKDSNFYYFILPVVTSGIDSWGIKTLSQKRENPYEIPSMADESYSYTITLPASLACFTPDKKLSVSNKAGTFTWEVKNENGKLSVRRQLKFSERIFPATEYRDFKILMDYWNNMWYRQLIFTVNREQ